MRLISESMKKFIKALEGLDINKLNEVYKERLEAEENTVFEDVFECEEYEKAMFEYLTESRFNEIDIFDWSSTESEDLENRLVTLREVLKEDYPQFDVIEYVLVLVGSNVIKAIEFRKVLEEFEDRFGTDFDEDEGFDSKLSTTNLVS